MSPITWQDLPSVSTPINAANLQSLTLVVNVKDPLYGAVGNGSTDDTAAINAAIVAASAVKGIVYFPTGTYMISSTRISIQNNVILRGAGWQTSTIKLANAANSNMTVSGTKTDVAFEDLTIDGNSANQSAGGIGLFFTPTRGRVSRCRFLNTRDTAVVFSGATVDCLIENCIFDGCGGSTGGVARIDASGTIRNCVVRNAPANGGHFQVITDCVVADNRIVQTTVGGSIKLLGSRSRATNNLIDKSGQASTTGDATAITTNFDANDCVISGNTILSTFSAAIHVGGSGASTITASRNLVTNNIVNGGAGDGIIVGGSTATGADNVVSNNRVDAIIDNSANVAGMFGVGIEVVSKRATIIGNVITSCANPGIVVGSPSSPTNDSGGTIVANNLVRLCGSGTGGLTGIRIGASNTLITGNYCVDNGPAAGTGYGILLQSYSTTLSLTAITAQGNVCTDLGSGNQDYGIGLLINSTATIGNSVIRENVLAGNVTGTINDTTAVTTNSYARNAGETTIPAISSATTTTLTRGPGAYSITGTTTITSVTAMKPGDMVTLIFAGVLTFTDGSNLKLAGNFVTTADDSITLICDGTNWVEVARAVN